MKKYKVIKPVMVTFLTAKDVVDTTLNPDDGEFFLETDGFTIWVSNKDQRQETITMANAIDIWMTEEKITLCE